MSHGENANWLSEFLIALRPELLPDYPGCRESEMD